ncbi:TonB-dependent receptor [Roseomonas haemaphysalidis]|uniref:TonB-dependent receptor n=1 Tax=Roseomonas haemaphysalidis TaxID=2768162 RepID=UPI003013CEA3
MQATPLARSLATGVLACSLAGPALAQAPQETTSPLLLPTVEVTARGGVAPGELQPAYAGGQVAEGGSLGLLGSTRALDTPFSTQNFTSQLIEDQQARTAADTLINDSSVRLTTGSNGFSDEFQIRGLAVPAGDVGFNGLYGLLSSNRVPAELIERIELIKGPSALINGIAPNGSVGGGINIVPKRAGEEPLTRLTTTYLGAANLGAHVDVGRRYGSNNEWGVRFNGLIRDGETSIDGGDLRSNLATLGLDYRGERFRWSADAIFQRDETDEFRPQISILTGVTEIPKPPNARRNWFPGTTLTQQDTTLATRAEYDLTDDLMVYGAIGYRDGKNQQIFPVAGGIVRNGDFTLRNSYYDSYSETLSGTVGARWRFNTAGIGHTLNVAYTGFQQENGNAYIQSSASVPSNLYDPSPLPIITAPRTDPRRSNFTTLSSFAVADTLNFGDRAYLTLGARQQNVDVKSYNTTTGARTSGYDASATTPLAGLVIKPLENVSLYASYAEGLTRGAIVGPSYTNAGAVLNPYKSEQYEAGVKVDWGRITTTAAVFQITRPSSAVDANNNQGYGGEQRNRGIELSAFGEIVPGLRGIVGATFLQPELTKPAIASQRGNDAAGVPDRTFSAALDWQTPLEGFALTGRMIYTSGAYLTTANTQRFDAWTRFDIGARYRTVIADKPVVFRASLENVFDEQYWLTAGTYVTTGSPRTVLVSASIDF